MTVIRLLAGLVAAPVRRGLRRVWAWLAGRWLCIYCDRPRLLNMRRSSLTCRRCWDLYLRQHHEFATKETGV